MSNTQESDLERAVKHNTAWIKLWQRTECTPDTAPKVGHVAEEVHAALSLDPELLRDAYNEAWSAGYRASEVANRARFGL